MYAYRYELIILKGQQSPIKHTKDFTRKIHIHKKNENQRKHIWNFPVQQKSIQYTN